MTSHRFSSRLSGVAMRRLALALVCSAAWATRVAFASVSGPTYTVTRIGVPPGEVRSEASGINHAGQAAGSIGFTDGEQYLSLGESGAAYDLDPLIGNAPYSMTHAQSTNDKAQIAAHQHGPKGQIETVLLTPTAIPLPSALWAALTVVPLMLLSKQIRRIMR